MNISPALSDNSVGPLSLRTTTQIGFNSNFNQSSTITETMIPPKTFGHVGRILVDRTVKNIEDKDDQVRTEARKQLIMSQMSSRASNLDTFN
jgi:hypothetical protein